MSLEMSDLFQVRQCSSGAEAIKLAPSFNPQVVLLDIMMPEMSGETTLQKLRELDGLADMPAIFMTARVQSYEIAKYKGLGVLDVIIKPFDPLELPQKIVQILQEHRYLV